MSQSIRTAAMVFPGTGFWRLFAPRARMCRRPERSARDYPGETVRSAPRSTRRSPARAALLVLAHHRGFRFSVTSRCMGAAVPPRGLLQLALAVFSARRFALGVG